MEFFSLLALILLTLAGYSSGNVLAALGRKALPAIIDLPVTLTLWVSVLVARLQLGRGTGILFGFGLGLAVGLLFGALRRRQYELETTAPESGFRTQWWSFNNRLGEFQSRLFLAWFYFIIVTPFGLITRFTSDRLHLRPPRAASLWLERPAAERPDEARARRQF